MAAMFFHESNSFLLFLQTAILNSDWWLQRRILKVFHSPNKPHPPGGHIFSWIKFVLATIAESHQGKFG